MLLELTKIDERESYFREVSYSGFLRPGGQNKHKHKVTIHTQETYKETSNNHQEHTRYEYQGHLTTRDIWG
jgi:hypothetical protein